MPWHISKSDLRKIYDDRHGDVCVCQTVEQAAIIVDAVNRLRSSGVAPIISLREPSADKLDTYEPDSCCGPGLAKAARGGVLKALLSWDCPRCGEKWVPRDVGGLRHWEPVPAVEILRFHR